MQITEVRVVVEVDGNDSRLAGYASVVFDRVFVVHNLRIIRDAQGLLFVAMPTRKRQDRCSRCTAKNILQARYCNQCAGPLPDRVTHDETGRPELHADICHPICNDFRKEMRDAILRAYHDELSRRALNARPEP